MRKIKKLRLINWHFFDDQEINFADINVITGENGTGKPPSWMQSITSKAVAPVNSIMLQTTFRQAEPSKII